MSERTNLLVSCAAGFLAGCVMISVAWDHNPQEAYHGEGGLAWTRLLLMFVFYGVPVAFLTMVVLESLSFVIDGLARRRK